MEKFYYATLSTYSMKTLIAAYEKEAPIEKISINLMDPAVKTDFQKTYPLGKVPFLVTKNNNHIPESSLIIEHWDNTYKTNERLIPTNWADAQKVRLFDRYADLYLNNSITNLWFESLKPEGQQNKELITKSKNHLDFIFKYLDENIKTNTFATGETFTLADCSLFPGLFYCKNYYPYTNYTNLNSYFSRVFERSSVQNLMKEVAPALERWNTTASN